MAGESFRVVSGNAAGTQIQLEGEFQIGRAAPVEGRLGDDPELSRAHAKVYRDPQGRMVIEDLGSTNGTAVNGQRISAPTVLNPGDTIQVGKSTLSLQGGAGAPGATMLGAPAGAAAVTPPPPAAAAPPPPPPPPAAPAPAAPFGGPTPGALGAPAAAKPGGGNRNLLFALLGLLAVAGVVVAIVLLAGGSSEPSDDDARAALTSFIEDPSCNDLTERAVESTFGGDSACPSALPDGVDEGDYEITSFEVDGEQADAEVDSDENVDGDWQLEMDGDDWKVDALPTAVAQAPADTPTDTDATPTPAPEPTPTEEEDPRRIEAIATLEALIQAVKDDDEKVFCGLLSPRQAQKLVGGAGGDAAIARCVEVAARVDLSKNLPDEISVTGVRVSGNQASVRLTTGERFTLVRRGGRFVIDSGLG